jgi:DNA-binding CsgD family transcriptional regulator/PAS domain-containing protein
MTEAEELSDVIASIYDTALDPTLWMAVLEKTARFVGGKAAVLASHDTASGAANFNYLWGDDPNYTAHYMAHLAKTNPIIIPVHLYCEPGNVFSLSQIASYDEYCRSRIYREWAEPQGWGDFSHFLTEKSGTRFGHFGVAHAIEESPVGDEPRRKLGLLMPHVTRAVSIAKAMHLRKLEAETLSATVDALSAAVFLIGPDETITYANASAQAMLDEGHVLKRAADGRLSAVAPTDRAELGDAIAALTADAAARTGAASVILLNGKNGGRFVAHLVSLTSGQREQAGRMLGATGAIFVHQAELKRPTLIQFVAKRFGLTEAESRVLFTILEAGGVQETAAVLGVSDETVRTHLKRLFRKTDTRRQADLVRLIGEMANPMAG